MKRWLANLARASPITAEVAKRRLGKACELLSLTPHDMLEKATKNLKGLQDSFEDLVAGLEGDGKAPSYIIGILKTVRSWLRYNDVTLTRTIKVRNPSEESALVKEAQIEALKVIAKNVYGMNLIDAKTGKERELGKELTPAEELEAYESEIRKLRIDPQKLRKQEDARKYQNKLVRERELERYRNKGWEMVQTVNSRILIRKPLLTSKPPSG